MTYRVIVGNIGTVRSGVTFQEALATFKEYKGQSVRQVGRAAGESVTILNNDGDTVREYIGKLDRKGDRL